MSVVVIGTGRNGEGITGLRLERDEWDEDQKNSPTEMFAIYVRDIDADESGASVQRNIFLKGVEEFFDVTVQDKSNNAFGTAIHESVESLTRPANEFPQVGDTITEYWQLQRARAADAVLTDVDGAVWALDEDDEGNVDWAAAVLDPLEYDDPDGLYITDVFPATVIYIRGQVGLG